MELPKATKELKRENGKMEETVNLKRPTASLGQLICTVGGKPTRRVRIRKDS